MKAKKHKSTRRSNLSLLSYFSKHLSIVVGLVLIWRGVWYVLDYFDLLIFKDNHLPLAVGGIILGLLILYLPDKDLHEIDKL